MTSVLFLAGAICELTGTTGEFSWAMILAGIVLHGVLFRELTSECINAAYLSRYHGRKKVMMYSGVAFMVAAILLASAEQISMIVIGRILQGIAISFASVSVPIYNSGVVSTPSFDFVMCCILLTPANAV